MTEPTVLPIQRIELARDALAGQVAVVTGAGRGIGREIARALAWLGARVVVAEIAEAGRETERLVREAGGEALFVQTDVSDEASVAELARRTRANFGPAGVLINNAILCPTGSVLETDAALWDRVIAVNLRGTFLTCRAFLPDMLARGSGTIVNMISTDAMPYLSAYIASKQGIAAFSQSLAGEVGEQGVRVIAFAPGFVDTPGLRGAAQGLAPHMGISVEEYLRLPIHPAYAEAMPAGDAAAATAYLVAVLADDYHGEQVNGYTVLERAGFIAAEAPAPAPIPAPLSAGAPPPAAARVTVLQEAIALSEQVSAILAETETELNKWPVFVRPMARQGFKGKAGQSLKDWTRTMVDLTQQLRRVQEADGEAEAALRARYPKLKESLGKLLTHYREAPAEVARFVKETDTLQQIQRITDERVAAIEGLIATLDTITR